MRLRLTTVTGTDELLHGRTEDVVEASQLTGIPVRMLNDMLAMHEDGCAAPVSAIERALRPPDHAIRWRVEVERVRDPDHGTWS